MVRRVWTLRTPDEALAVAREAASGLGWSVEAALAELVVNAVEHGNLELGFDAKRGLIARGELDAEIGSRLALDRFAARTVRLFRDDDDGCTEFSVEDDGLGFDWVPWLRAPGTVRDASSGRGIYLAATLGGASLHYAAGGRCAVLRVSHPGDACRYDDG